MPQAKVDGLRISYEVTGSGEPVLFLPGTTQGSLSWVNGTSAHLTGYRAICIDPRDTPASDESPGAYTPRDLAGDALGVLDDAGVDSAHVVGYSLGGTVAQELALEAPERVRSLVLICSWARADPWLRHSFELLRDGLLQSGEDWFARAVVQLALSPPLHDGPPYEMSVTMLAGRGQKPEATVRQLECDIAHAALERLGEIRCPTLVVAGADDVWLPPRYSREIADAIPHAKLVVFDGIGHSLPLERAEEFFALLRDHLAGKG